ncbi:MAG: PilZ domain-containing protein [Armatimonadetes bacterium]|nr:PilZ domain-containing protein [Armatimonadota bacterium]
MKLVRWLTRRSSASNSGADRRRLPRQQCSLAAVCSLNGQALALATVTDIGPGGVAMSMALDLRPGSYVEVQSGSRSVPPVRCRVVWCRGDHGRYAAGLTFVAAPKDFSRSWVPGVLAQLGLRKGKLEQRQSSREGSPPVPVEVRTPEGRLLGHARLVDFSATGARLQSAFRIREISKVQLCFYGTARQGAQEFRAQVRYWTPAENGSFHHGIRFLDLDAGRTRYLKSLATQIA